MSTAATFSFIGIGNELLKGITADENGPWLAKFLTQQGLSLTSVQLCGDDEEQVVAALEAASRCSSIAVLSGGLGPTRDDLTRQILSRYSEGMGGWQLSAIANPVGLACGLWGRSEKQSVIALPGVPWEFQQMFAREVFPLLIPAEYRSRRERQTIRSWGMSEARIFQENPNLWGQLATLGTVSSLPQVLGVDIGVDLEGTVEEREQKKREVLKIFQNSTLWPHIWQVGPLSLPEYLIQKLQGQSTTVGFCESCTGGLASHSLTDIDGSSKVFLGSVICYSSRVKQQVLGVSPDILKQYGAVSEEVALALAMGGKRVLGVDYCVAYTGIAGPGGGSEENPVGTVAIALATPASSFGSGDGVVKTFHFKGDRVRLKQRFFTMGLLQLLQQLISHSHSHSHSHSRGS